VAVRIRKKSNCGVRTAYGTDGSFISLPQDATLAQYFGGLGQPCTTASALASLVYDLQNDSVVDAKIAPVRENERSLSQAHVRELLKPEGYNTGYRELLVYESGYPSQEFIKALSAKEIAYVMRIQKGFIPQT
jgi:DNA-dependent RNA polymerase auxiliary subunit epsilon